MTARSPATPSSSPCPWPSCGSCRSRRPFPAGTCRPGGAPGWLIRRRAHRRKPGGPDGRRAALRRPRRGRGPRACPSLSPVPEERRATVPGQRGAEPGSGPVWRVPGMSWLLAAATLWFSGYALLVGVAPLWVIRGGSGSLGAGLVTGVMMACTVLAQLSMRRLLGGLGWRWTLVLGSALLGLPALGHLATDRLWAVTALAALRGLGFGVITVCAGTAVAAFVAPPRRGRAIGALGLSSAAPQFVLVPLAPWLAEQVGFWLVFALAVLPALAIPLAWPIARVAGDSDRVRADVPGRDAAAVRRALRHALAGPIAALVVITASGGAILTFAPHILASPAFTFWGLLAFTGTAAVTRWGA